MIGLARGEEAALPVARSGSAGSIDELHETGPDFSRPDFQGVVAAGAEKSLVFQVGDGMAVEIKRVQFDEFLRSVAANDRHAAGGNHRHVSFQRIPSVLRGAIVDVLDGLLEQDEDLASLGGQATREGARVFGAGIEAERRCPSDAAIGEFDMRSAPRVERLARGRPLQASALSSRASPRRLFRSCPFPVPWFHSLSRRVERPPRRRRHRENP